MNRDANALRAHLRGCLVTAAFCAAGSLAQAQTVGICDTHTQLNNVLSPAAAHLRHYAEGDVIVAVVDDGRADVGTALSVLVVSPPFDAHGERQCRMIRAREGFGYAAILLDRSHATYDPATGLTVRFPGVVFPTDDSLGQRVDLMVTINQATGMITPAQSPPAE